MWRSLALSLILVATSAHAEAPRDKLSETLSSLKQSKEDAAELKQKLESTEREMRGLREDATELASQVQEAERRVDDEEKKNAVVNTKLAAKQRAFEARQQEYAETLSALLQVQKMPMTALLADSKNTQELLRTSRAMQQVNDALADQATQLKREMDALTKLKRTAQASKQKLAQESASLTQRQAQLNKDLAQRQAVQKRLNKDLATTQSRVDELSKASADLQDLISKLEADRAMVAQKGASKKIGSAPARGHWKLPVAGKLTHPFGERKNANETYRGLVLASRASATVVAPAAGEVVFTGPFRDYGKMVLLKHGNNRISLLAGLGNINVVLNQPVAAGEPLGSMGGGSPSLYYELREDGKPIDPTNWFANLGANLAKQR